MLNDEFKNYIILINVTFRKAIILDRNKLTKKKCIKKTWKALTK